MDNNYSLLFSIILTHIMIFMFNLNQLHVVRNSICPLHEKLYTLSIKIFYQQQR
ncbi:hypothetical protein NTGBS_70046 [Candidatus Nitrotoga sp. BS]|nr:hypothetical protein NTGBS_70046 [Candidatus Nitrotoga sp. BS]